MIDTADSGQYPLLRVAGLTTTVTGPDGRVALIDDLSFSVDRGEVVGIVGESGSGKTITALSILRLLPEASCHVDGVVEFAGRDLMALSERGMRQVRGRDIAMIFQDPMTSLNPVIPVGVQIREVLQVHKGLDRRAAHRRAIELLEMVEIPDAKARINDYQHEFSGGMRQRVMIAMALSCDPKLVIADEATTALDVTVQAQILELLTSLTRTLGTSIILITHDLGVIAAISDRVLVMYSGQFVESAPVQRLFDDPQSPYSLGLLESIPQVSSGGRAKPLATIEGYPPRPGDARRQACRFADRCRFARAVCGEKTPGLLPRGPQHLARCFGTEENGWVNEPALT